jgi:DNA-binding MarR family transcriptional regulator
MSERKGKGIVGKLQAMIRNRKTYQIGLLQAKAYRILKHHTTEALAPLNISTTEWAFLGLLYDAETSIRASTAAEELGVEAPFITVLIKKLTHQGLVTTKTDKDDSRVKLLSLTPKGRTFVVDTEVYVRNKVRPLGKGAGISDIAGYVAVLESIIQNSSTEKS